MSSAVCIDANIIIRTLVPGPHSERALAHLERWQQQATQLTAPALLSFEVSSTLRRMVHIREITPAHGEKAFTQFLRLPIRLSSRRALFPLAWRLAVDLGLPRTYDTSYLALARLSQCDLWTADQKFYNAVKGKAMEVRWVADDGVH
jgi:predicted nucleic acid-binding protein